MVFFVGVGKNALMKVFFLIGLVLSIASSRFDEKIESEELAEDDFSITKSNVPCDNSTHCIGCSHKLKAGYICGVNHEHCDSCPRDSLAA